MFRVSIIEYSQNSLNPYLSVDSPGYGFSEVMGWRGWEKNKRSRKLTEISRKSYFLGLLDQKANIQHHLGKSLLMDFSSMVLASWLSKDWSGFQVDSREFGDE